MRFPSGKGLVGLCRACISGEGRDAIPMGMMEGWESQARAARAWHIGCVIDAIIWQDHFYENESDFFQASQSYFE